MSGQAARLRGGGTLGLELVSKEAKKLVCKEVSNLVRKLSPRPSWEKAEFVNERSEFTNSGEGENLDCHASNDNPPQPSLKKGGRMFAFTLAEGATHVAIPKKIGRDAFTLAEALITLGVIGIVAALVMPGVINNYKREYLKVRFKKSDSVIQQAMQKTLTELGMVNFSDLLPDSVDLHNDSDKSATIENFIEFNKVWDKQFNYSLKMNYTQFNRYLYSQAVKYYDFWGTYQKYGASYFGPSSELWNYYSYYILPDGMIIGSLDFGASSTSSKTAMLFFDINGLKGPNRKGYDFFLYQSNPNYFRSECNPLVNNTYKLDGCYQYAHKDLNPIDKSKGYFESLYRSKSWWENLKSN